MKAAMNPWQAAVAKQYADGDFAHFATDPHWRANLEGCGDTLFSFLMIELSSQEDCDGPDEAVSRLERARDDIDDAIASVTAARPKH